MTAQSIELAAPKYPGVIRALHWCTVVKLSLVYFAAWVIAWPELHRSLGLTILTLTLLRLFWRQRAPLPSLPLDMHHIHRRVARTSVAAIYVLLLLQPILGLAGSMLRGDRIEVFFGHVVPNLLPLNPQLGRAVFQVHGWSAALLLVMIVMHVGAALHHHLIRRDDVLDRMLPDVPSYLRLLKTRS